MNRKINLLFLYFFILVLFLQSIISIYLFSQGSPDGGFWPFVLVIFGTVNIIYLVFISWIVQRFNIQVLHASLSTLILSGCLFSLSNFARLFGDEGHAAVTKIGLGTILKSDVVPYLLYVIFAVLPFLGNLRKNSC
jgi:hypothetical protein